MDERTFAETTALQALAWVLADDTRAQAFLAATGADPTDLVASAADPGFLGAVLDFLLTDDAFVTGFCDAQALPYGTVLRVRPQLPGFSQMHWT